MNMTTSILVVDDDPAVLQLFSKILRAEGHRVWEASTGQQALQVAREKRPDLVVSDVMLPDLSGIEVCRQIKADAALTDVFVVLISGEAVTVPHKVHGLDTGADDYLVKPVDLHEFLARLRTIMRLRNTTVALRASEQRYRQLVEILPEAAGLIDLQGRFLAMNPQGAAAFGYANPIELLERSVFDVTQTRQISVRGLFFQICRTIPSTDLASNPPPPFTRCSMNTKSGCCESTSDAIRQAP